MPVPKGLEPTGVILADKPAGPSSFAIVARVRSRTGAKTGHAGTLDPFATGLLILLSGRATSLQDRFMKVDKRYVTEVDLRLRTTTGDPEGEALDEHPAPSGDELERSLDALRGDVELPIPAASAVKIGGTRAYRLHRQGVAVQMPTRVMHVHRLDLLAYDQGVARIDLHVGSGTYVRALADALGGHCVSLRRTEIGPFAVEESDETQMIPLEDALRRLATVRESPAQMRIAHAPSQLDRRPRAVAIGTFDGVHRGHRSVLRATVGSGLEPTVITLDPHPRIVLGNRVELLTTLERRLELLAEAGISDTLVAAFTPEFMRLAPEEFVETYLRAIGAEAVAVGADFRFGSKRAGTVATLRALGLEVLAVEEVQGVSSTAIRDAWRAGITRCVHARASVRARRDGRRRRPARRHARLSDGEHRDGRAADLPPLRDLRRRGAGSSRRRLDRDESALRRDGAADRAVPPRLRRRPLRLATGRGAMGTAPRRGGVRLRGGARCADLP